MKKLFATFAAIWLFSANAAEAKQVPLKVTCSNLIMDLSTSSDVTKDPGKTFEISGSNTEPQGSALIRRAGDWEFWITSMERKRLDDREEIYRYWAVLKNQRLGYEFRAASATDSKKAANLEFELPGSHVGKKALLRMDCFIQ